MSAFRKVSTLAPRILIDFTANRILISIGMFDHLTFYDEEMFILTFVKCMLQIILYLSAIYILYFSILELMKKKADKALK